MRLADKLRQAFLEGQSIDPREFAEAHGYTRQGVTDALTGLKPLVKCIHLPANPGTRGANFKTNWVLVDREGMEQCQAQALRRGSIRSARRPRLVLHNAPEHWHPLLEAWGLPIRPIDLPCEAHAHIQPMTGDDDEL